MLHEIISAQQFQFFLCKFCMIWICWKLPYFKFDLAVAGSVLKPIEYLHWLTFCSFFKRYLTVITAPAPQIIVLYESRPFTYRGLSSNTMPWSQGNQNQFSVMVLGLWHGMFINERCWTHRWWRYQWIGNLTTYIQHSLFNSITP